MKDLLMAPDGTQSPTVKLELKSERLLKSREENINHDLSVEACGTS